MTLQMFLMRAALGAGAVILAIGLAVAQTAPTPPPGPGANAPAAEGGRTDRRAARDACRNQIGTDLRGDARREAMRKCMAEQRGAAGPKLTEAERERVKELRKADRTAVKEARKTCRAEVKDQRLTEDERRNAIETCIAKGNPQFAKSLNCRRDAEAKKLEKRTGPYRDFMRSCMRAA